MDMSARHIDSIVYFSSVQISPIIVVYMPPLPGKRKFFVEPSGYSSFRSRCTRSRKGGFHVAIPGPDNRIGMRPNMQT